MEDHRGLFSFIRDQQFARQSIALATIASLFAPTADVFAADEFFRQTKETYAPRPFLQPDFPDGAFTQSLPIVVPPGRNEIQPDIRLSYSSQDRRNDSIVGYGWSLNVPYIERLNKYGTDRLYNQPKSLTSFYSSLSGELLPFTSTSTSGSVLGYSLSSATLPTISPPKLSHLAQLDQSAGASHGANTASAASPRPIADAIEGLTARDRANTKGQAIAAIGSIPKTEVGDYAIEVVSMEAIEGGIQVFARAWDTSGRQIGFGREGVVDIERFRIFNPPILVPDGTTRTVLGPDGVTEHQIDNYREDLSSALLESLAETIKAKKEQVVGGYIEVGRVGRTTSTFYPDGNPESSSVDGYAQYDPGSAGTAWGTVIAASGNGANDTNTSCSGVGPYFDETSFGSQQFRYNVRSRLTFDTSALPDTDTVSSATVSLTGDCETTYTPWGHGAAAVTIGLYGMSSVSSNTSVANADYQNVNSTAQSDISYGISGWNEAGTTTNDFPLNTNGLTTLSKTGQTHFSLRDVTYDVGATAPPDRSAGYSSFLSAYAADQTGTTNDPKLVVEHTASPPLAPTSLEVNGAANPYSISTTSPYFSAIHANGSSTALATTYQIQISATSSFGSTLTWDSGQKTLSSSTPQGQRTPNLHATSTLALDGTTYYWRIRFWDQTGVEGLWSTTTDLFQMTSSLEGDYAAKVEQGDFMRYALTLDNKWTAYDKHGVMYRFGHAANARLYDPTASTEVFRWYLEEMRDPNGNSMTYTYATTTVASGATSQIYPYRITYTANGAASGIYEVEFVRESRTDIATSSSAGYAVVANERIKEILVRTNGQLTHRYVLSYGQGDNYRRSLLTSLQESGWSQAVGTTTLPATTFGYSTSTNSWTSSMNATAWQLPSWYFVDSAGSDTGLRMLDVSGDALPDMTYRHDGTNYIHLNTGNGWSTTTNTALANPYNLTGGDLGIRMGDLNGDGYIDMIRSYLEDGVPQQIYKSVYLGGASGWSSSGNWTPPVYFSVMPNGGPTAIDQGSRLVDVNGDGLSDLVSGYVYINNGRAFVLDPTWSFPVSITYGTQDGGVRLLDLNGDGLTDVFVSRELDATKRIYLNNGYGWTETNWATSTVPYFVYEYGDKGYRFADVSGDGLPDIVGPSGAVYLNNGAGWTQTSSTFPVNPVYLSGTSFAQDMGVVVDDVNGDGLPDEIQATYTSGPSAVRGVYLKDGVKGDLLTRVANEKGSTVTVAYQSTAALDSTGQKSNPTLQLNFDVLKTVATDPGFGGAIGTTTYAYFGASYYYASTTERQWAGFASSTKTNAAGNTTRTYFHQGNTSDSSNGEYNDHLAKVGRPYQIEMLDATTSSASLYSRTVNKWARAAHTDGRNFVKLVRSLVMTYDGDSTHKDKAEETTYDDATANASERVNLGEVLGNADGTLIDTGSDRASTTYTYAASSTQAAMSLPSRELVADQSSTTVKDTKWTYDGLAFGSVSAGNVTKEERLIAGSAYASTTKTYNSYGLVTESRDPNGNATTYTYDSHNLYPATITNALGQAATNAYDYASGKVATTTDPNSRTFATVYDGLGRPVEEKQPDFTTPSTLVLKTSYTYSQSTSSPWSVLRTDWLSSATSTDLYSYLDGLGRTLQTRKEAESVYGYAVRDWIYDNSGRLRAESLPYFSSGSSRTTATSATHLFSTYAYDPEGRITALADVFGTTTNAYSDWRLTVTDPLTNKKDFYKDAYGNLSTVVEYPSSGATTTYTWNLLGKLTRITDAASNIRNFTYDLLGRLTGSEDLHASADSTFGTTSRQYDLAGNLIQFYNPNGNAITYTYDALNRVTSEDATTTAAGLTDVVYRYDTCTNGVGRLCQVNANGSATSTYAYNPIGLVATEAKQIGSSRATTSTTYVRNGAPDTITYPTGHQVANVYNDSGDLYRVLGLAVGSTTWNSLVDATTYGPLGKPTIVDYGNNTKTTYTFDQTKRYRLTQKLTVSTSTTPTTPEQLLFLGMSFLAKQLRKLAQLDMPGAKLPVIDVGSTTEPESEATSILDVPPPDAVAPPVVEQAETITPANGESADTNTVVESISDAHVSVGPVPFSDAIKELSAHERANAKGQAIAELGHIERTHEGDYDIEALSMEPIDGGVQVFAKAWDTNDQAIGFGKDGTVEIERFRIFNPPILVPDGTKRTVFGPDGVTEHQVDNYREDLGAALLVTLTQAIEVKKERFDDSRIVLGKVGRTTSIFYPDGNPESSSVDGFAQYDPGNPGQSWATVIAASGNGANDSQSSCNGVGVNFEETSFGTQLFRSNARSRLTFDTSALPDTDTVSSATVSLTGDCETVYTPWTHGAAAVTIGLYGMSSVSSNTSVANADYQNVNATAQSDTSYGITGWNEAGTTTNDFPLNATGLTTLSKTGQTHFSLRDVTYDVGATAPPDRAAGYSSFLSAYSADQTGTTNDPMLVVEHGGDIAPAYTFATTTLQDLNYTYDAVGNITQIIDRSGTRAAATTTYTYDNLYRLLTASTTGATSTPFSYTYTYDVLGNIATGSLGTYTYSGSGFLNPHAASQIGATNYVYDKAGNITSAGSQSLAWDPWNRLSSTSLAGTTTGYTYDHAGQRVTHAVNRGSGTTTTNYWHRFFETTGATTTLYVWAGDQLVATVEGNGVATSTYIAHTDHLNGTNVMSDKNGTLAQLSTYYPFGAIRQNEKPANNFNETRKFIGQTFDDSTSLSYLNARYYDGTRGQFLGQDPIARDIGAIQKRPAYILMLNQAPGSVDQTMLLSDPQLLNSYAYSRNNPTTLSDPSGQNPFLLGAVVGAVFGVGQQAYTDAHRGEFSGLSAYGRQAITGGFTGVGVVAAAPSVLLAGGIAFLGAYTSSVQGDAYSPSNTSGEIDQGKAITQGIVSVATMGAGKALLPGVTGPFPKVSTLVGNFSTNPVSATANFFVNNQHARKEIVQQMMTTLTTLLVEVNATKNSAPAPAAPANKKSPRRRRREQERDVVYEPSRRWLKQAFIPLVGLAVLAAVLTYLEHGSDPSVLSMLTAAMLGSAMFYGLWHYGYFALKGDTLSLHDLFHVKQVNAKDIRVVEKTRKGFFGTTELVSTNNRLVVNHALFDRETVDDLIEDLLKLNPSIVIENA